ncbi:hypothetical protein GCM10028791_19920 [Echinicola sediminis]
MSQLRSISIIIPNYNGRELLKKYLPSTFKAAAAAQVPYEVILVDDASKDESLAFVRKNFPEVKTVVNKENRGFSFTCNQGIKAAKMDLVLLLNSDVALEENYFEKLWKYFEQPDTFGVMGRIVNTKGHIEDAARMMAFQGLKFKATRFYYSTHPDACTPTAYLSGANALVDRRKLLELGGFDEIYSPYYVEDVDLSFRAWRMGWKCYYEHRAVCHHEVSSTTKKEHGKRHLYPILYRNKFILQAIHLQGAAFAFWQMQLLLVEILPRLILGKWWILKAYALYLKSKDQIAESKKRLPKQAQSKSLFDIKKEYFDPLKEREVE